MTDPSPHDHFVRQRRAMYSFGNYNPYLPVEQEKPLVEENLARLKSGQIDLRAFLRQTPHFARWQEEHLRQARVLLVTNEPGLSAIEQLYGDLVRGKGARCVADHFCRTMLSWLALSNHPGLNAIHGEAPWLEGGPWQAEHPRLAGCGKAGYFLLPGEETALAGCKVLHIELSPFAQNSGHDLNPRNDQELGYHPENLQTVQRFCSFATPEHPRHIFIVGNRARIRAVTANSLQLEALRSSRKDKSEKIVDLLRIAQLRADAVQVRLCRQWPRQGRNVEVLKLVRATVFELCPL